MHYFTRLTRAEQTVAGSLATGFGRIQVCPPRFRLGRAFDLRLSRFAFGPTLTFYRTTAYFRSIRHPLAISAGFRSPETICPPWRLYDRVFIASHRTNSIIDRQCGTLDVAANWRRMQLMRSKRMRTTLKPTVLYTGILRPLTLGPFLYIAILLAPFSAWAALGDTAASVLTDQARMKGTLHSSDQQTYVVHEIQTPAGTKVREYVSPQGAVFAVAWEGQFQPDLHQLMGPYYQQAKDAAAQQVRHGHGPMLIQTDGLVVESAGSQRNIHGRAYIPQMLPKGVEAREIQ